MSKPIGKDGIKLIKKFEGCKLTAYQDVIGVWTIGWGHTANVKKGDKITQKQADVMLVEDCQKFADSVDRVTYVPLTRKLNEHQRDALISFAYNCGSMNLKMLCKNRSLHQISHAILLYNKAGGKKIQGLVNRRVAEQKLFNSEVED